MPRKLSRTGTGFSLASSSSHTSASTSAPNATTTGLLPGVLSDGQPLPRLVVFDLDYTLWPFWVDTHVYAPLKANADHSAATDKIGETFAFYRDVPAVLHGLAAAGVRMAVASRTQAPDLGREMLKLLHVPAASALFPPPPAGGGGSGGGDRDGGVEEPAQQPAKSGGGKKDKADKPRRALEFFDAGMEIYPSSKIRHFEALGKKTGIPFTDMLFFDDESRNRETETLGVTMWLVRDGVSWHEVEKGIEEWRRRRARDGGS